MALMKAIQIYNYGGSEMLVYEDVPRPAPGADELLVQVRAAGVNPMDWKMREGYVRAWVDPPLPLILGCDLAGEVVAVGSAVRDFAVGDAVFGMVRIDKGTHAEYIAVSPQEIARKPTTLDYVAAAAVPLSALAAWQALVEIADVQAGQTVLVHGAAGGVGSFAVQFAHGRGAHVVGTDSQANAEFVRSLGADEVIAYETTRFEAVVPEVDVVLDTLGGETQARSWSVVKPGGVLVTLIYLAPEDQERAAARGVRGVMMGAQPNGAQLQEIAALIDAGQVRPVVRAVLPLAEARQAYDQVQSGQGGGKVVLQVTSDNA